MTIRRSGSLGSLLVLLTVSAAWAQSPGHVNFSSRNYPSFDIYTNTPSFATEQWLQTHFLRMGVYSPYFDTKTSWYSGAQFYDDLIGILPAAQVRWDHPEWIMHDQYGNWLYINFACANGSCPSYAADISNPAFRAWWIAQAQATIARGHYPAIWIDDVDTNFSISDGYGNAVVPIDFNTRQPMTWAAWRAYVAQFLQQIRAAMPNVELLENTVWFAGPAGIESADPSIQQQIVTATTINLERGVVDPGLTGGTGPWSLYTFLNYIDLVHSLGPSVTLDHYELAVAQQQYALAGYYLISNGKDRYGDGTATPDNWWSGFNTELGSPLGARSYSNGVFQRSFSGGMVLLGEPGLTARTVNLPATYTTLAGATVNSVTIGASQGIILLATAAPPAPVTHYLSDLTPTYMVNGWGPLQLDKSTYGNVLSLGGVKYPKGLGAHAYAEARYATNGTCSQMNAVVGIDDEIPAGLGLVDFQVWGDGLLLYDSGMRTSGNPALSVGLNISGVQLISLVSTNGIYMAPSWEVPCDHADWANATIQCTH